MQTQLKDYLKEEPMPTIATRWEKHSVRAGSSCFVLVSQNSTLFLRKFMQPYEWVCIIVAICLPTLENMYTNMLSKWHTSNQASLRSGRWFCDSLNLVCTDTLQTLYFLAGTRLSIKIIVKWMWTERTVLQHTLNIQLWQRKGWWQSTFCHHT